MRIWIHCLLSGVAMFAGFFAGGLLTGLLLELIRGGPPWVVVPVVIVTMVAFIYGGLRAGEWLVRRLPARCPACAGQAYAEGHRPIRFRCSKCGHVHRTNMRTNWGAG
jgi:ribosomal protein S27AE